LALLRGTGNVVILLADAINRSQIATVGCAVLTGNLRWVITASGKKAYASKPEAQAEGDHVIWSPTRIPSARASGFLDFGFTQHNINKGKLREVTFLIHEMFFVGSWSRLPGVPFRSTHHRKANARDLTVVLPQLALRALKKELFPGACETAPSNRALADCLRSVRAARRSSASLIAVTRFATTRHRPLPAGRRRWR
jgi:hypothetical protein